MGDQTLDAQEPSHVSSVLAVARAPSLAAPIVLDYDGDGQGLISLTTSTIRFDMDGDGIAERTGWFEAGDALLVLDRNGDGNIADIAEISFVGDKAGAKTDLEGLAAFDSNGDEVLDASDARFADFRLWFDSNSNGVSDAGELKSLADAKVLGVSLRSVKSDAAPGTDNRIFGRGAFAFVDGKVGTLLDAGFAYFPEDAGTATALSAWSGGTTPSTKVAPASTALALARRSFEQKSKRYFIGARNGELVVNLRKAETIDPRAGMVPGATILQFKNKTIGMLAPIVLDLDGDGVELVALGKSRARFDMDGNGARDDTGWIGKGDGFLVIDRDNDGLITTAAELSFLAEKSGAKSDLEALAQLDSNRDRKLDATDTRFGELKVWVDADRDGITDAGELKTLAELNIASIGLAGTPTEELVKLGQNVLLATGTFTLADGTVRSLGDAALAFRPQSSVIGSASDRIDGLVGDMGEEGARLAGALRSGLRYTEGRLGLDVPPGIDPFDYFGDGDRAAAASAPLNLPEAVSAAAGIQDTRMALIVQEMASFGARTGEGDLRAREHLTPRFDYFA